MAPVIDGRTLVVRVAQRLAAAAAILILAAAAAGLWR